MILVIVYVGAVAVLFLFVVMMLDVNFAGLRKGAMQYVPLGSVLGAVLLAELVVLYKAWSFAPQSAQNIAVPTPAPDQVENTMALGHVLYTHYFFAFQVAGLVLLVAMIGAIVLTHRTRPGLRRQKIAEQVARKPADAMEIRQITPGTGA
jgi:NADH-quinone oxidoreductase subunit J